MIRELNRYLKLLDTICLKYCFVNYKDLKEYTYDPKYCILAYDYENQCMKKNNYGKILKEFIEL